ncbi:MAG: hypothetical protein ACHQUA_01235 [Microgenomates group bacterium]
MGKELCNRKLNTNGGCGECKVIPIAAKYIMDNKTIPNNQLLLEVAEVYCPEGLSPIINGDPALIANGQVKRDRESPEQAAFAI